MTAKRFLWNHRLAVVLLTDAVVLGVFWWFIPKMNRPFEALMAVVAVLGIATAVVVGNKLLNNLIVLVAAFAITFFALEMLQKFTNFMNLFQKKPSTVLGEGGPYAWDTHDAATYLRARNRALNDGVDPDALPGGFAGDIFAGMDKSQLSVKRQAGGNRVMYLEALKPPFSDDPPLGSELTPDNRFRHYCYERSSEDMLFDGEANVTPAGLRSTRSAGPDAKATWLFVGCSFTFGYGLSDNQTLPHYFAEAGGFRDRVVNLAVSGDGPNNCLRDLELNHRAGRAGVDDATVRGVFYSLIDDHVNRVVRPASGNAPYYELVDDRAVYGGAYRQPGQNGRLDILLDRARIIPLVRDRLRAGMGPFDPNYQWRLTTAILAEMNRICLQRYNAPLVVVYWGDDLNILLQLDSLGIPMLRVGGAFGEDWRAMAIKFHLADGHPSANANRLLGYYIQTMVPQESAE